MIKCKYCNKTFNSFSKFQRHLHQNICIPNTVAKKKKNDNNNDKKIKKKYYKKNNNSVVQNNYIKDVNINNLNIRNNELDELHQSKTINEYNNISTFDNNLMQHQSNSNLIQNQNNNNLINRHSNNNLVHNNNTSKVFCCKYCDKEYKYASGLSRHIKTCIDKKALEHFLGPKLKEKNMSLDEFIELRDMPHNKNKVVTQQVINNNIINNNTTNVQINMINPFGKENVEHILSNHDLCLQILKKMDNGVNKLFLEVYNKDENRNFYKLDKSGKKIATLTKENRINHNEYEYVIEKIFTRMHTLYNKISENLKSICTDKVNSCISKNMHKHEKKGILNSNKKTFDDYLNYMSKMNEELITNMLIDNGIIAAESLPKLDV